MSNWQIGDLALCVDVSPHRLLGPPPLEEGRIYVVAFAMNECGGLLLEGVSELPAIGFRATRFRKVVSDEIEACEPEFVTLLKRSKRKVEA